MAERRVRLDVRWGYSVASRIVQLMIEGGYSLERDARGFLPVPPAIARLVALETEFVPPFEGVNRMRPEVQGRFERGASFEDIMEALDRPGMESLPWVV